MGVWYLGPGMLGPFSSLSRIKVKPGCLEETSPSTQVRWRVFLRISVQLSQKCSFPVPVSTASETLTCQLNSTTQHPLKNSSMPLGQVRRGLALDSTQDKQRD